MKQAFLHARYYGCGAILGKWSPGAHYLAAIINLGSIVLSAVRNQEVSASRRLCKYYNYAECNP